MGIKSMSDVMEFMLERSLDNIPPPSLANMFDSLVWIMDDNGKNIAEVRAEWLQSNEKRKVEIALEMREVFPYETRDETINSFDRITKIWPDLATKCERILREWDQQYGLDK